MRPGPRLYRAVFVDRDGVLNHDVGHLTSIAQLTLFRDAAPALARLNRAGAPVVLVTNQSAVGHGELDLRGLARIHQELRRRLAAGGARIDAICVCPHRPGDGCSCRKPAPGLLLRAAARHGISLPGSVMIGDRPKDLEAGLRAGCGLRVLVTTQQDETAPDGLAQHAVPTLAAAVDAALGFLTRDRPAS
jgi:D-glycero-D-manno-heptose 1,7-bisphosphate phosphatase